MHGVLGVKNTFLDVRDEPLHSNSLSRSKSDGELSSSKASECERSPLIGGEQVAPERNIGEASPMRRRLPRAEQRQTSEGPSSSNGSRTLSTPTEPAPLTPQDIDVGDPTGLLASEDDNFALSLGKLVSRLHASGMEPVLSELHAAGKCKPCMWVHTPHGCNNGSHCRFCHLYHSQRNRPSIFFCLCVRVCACVFVCFCCCFFFLFWGEGGVFLIPEEKGHRKINGTVPSGEWR